LVHQAQTTEVDDGSVDEVVAALIQLRRSAACCAGGTAPLETPNVAPAPRRRGRRQRGRHRTQPLSDRFVLPEVTVLEPTVGRQVADVLVADGSVVDVVAPSGDATYEGYERLEAYRRCFVMPALTDMHSHLPPHNVVGLIDLFMLLFLAHGVTTVRDAGDTDGTSLPESRDGLASGRFVGPRLFCAGPFINKRGTERYRWSNSLWVDGPGDADRIARTLVGLGARCMKLYEGLTVEDIAALERAATEHGLVTLGHVPTQLGLEEARLADAQHFFGVAPPASLPRDHVLDRLSAWHAVDDARIDVIVRAAVEGGLANTPTLVVTERQFAAGLTGMRDEPSMKLLPRFFRDVVWHPRYGLPAYRNPDAARIDRLKDAMAKQRALVGRLYRAGATLRIGTDFQPGAVPGWALHKEMRLFEEAGVPAEVVLRMATRDAALALGEKQLGVVRKDAVADLIVCRDDPTRGLDALSTMRAVAHKGRLFAVDQLLGEVQDDLQARDRAMARIGAGVLARLSMWSISRRFVG
jgi:imidazolonepropionase-like amidohydrolase